MQPSLICDWHFFIVFNFPWNIFLKYDFCLKCFILFLWWITEFLGPGYKELVTCIQMWGWVTGSVARCPMCAVPAQLLAQLEITLGELQDLEQGTGRKSLMRWKAVCPTLGGGGKQGTQRLEDNFVCHLPSRLLTSHLWLEILCRKWTFTWWKKLFPTPKFHHMFVFQEALNFYLNGKATDDTFCLG